MPKTKYTFVFLQENFMQKPIDFRSDTVTKPTAAMRNAMANAEVGDDVMQEDPTINRLESLAAQMLGKEAALFVPSGTFGNQLAILTHTKRGDEIVIPDNAHAIQYEVGAAAVIAGVQTRTVRSRNAWLTLDELKSFVRTTKDIHMPDTGMIYLQNPAGNGDVMPLEEMQNIYEFAQKQQIPVHTDGARIFNAATALNVKAYEIAQFSDSVMFCLSKGLCAPVGSMLCGSADFIRKARKNRKLMGGGMRQAGILAAAGIIALEEMSLRLQDDHDKARRLAEIFAQYHIFDINPNSQQTNILYLKFKLEYVHLADKFHSEISKAGILTYPPRSSEIRFVTHNDISWEDMAFFEETMHGIMNSIIE